MKYRQLDGYKYQLMENYTTNINVYPSNDLIFRFIELLTTGQLLVKRGYAWDGATGLPITPKNMLRGSLVHDVLYQLMRLGALDYKVHRILADKLLKKLCIEDGTPKVEANCVYHIVQLVGKHFAEPTPEKEVVVLETVAGKGLEPLTLWS